MLPRLSLTTFPLFYVYFIFYSSWKITTYWLGKEKQLLEIDPVKSEANIDRVQVYHHIGMTGAKQRLGGFSDQWHCWYSIIRSGRDYKLIICPFSAGPSVSGKVGMLVRAREGRGGGGSHSEELHCSPGKVQQATDTVLSLWCTAVGTVVSLQSSVQSVSQYPASPAAHQPRPVICWYQHKYLHQSSQSNVLWER